MAKKSGKTESKTKREVPLSEDQKKFHENWTGDDCITELRRIAEAHPDQVITRNFFRVHSSISEATWNRYFGTFKEFKRQAGITLTRHQHRMELDVAKHASVDSYRRMNDQKAGLEALYKKGSDRRFKTALACNDVHDIECDPFWRRMFIEAARRAQPDMIVLDGDIFDLPEFGKYPVDPREWNVIGRIQWVHTFLADLRAVCPEAEFVFVEGNHEYRLLRHLAEASPAMRAVLSDLHGFTVPKLLGLDQYEVNYVARADLATFNVADVKKELYKNYFIAFDSVLFHHFPEGKDMGFPGQNGHHHKHLVWSLYSPQFGSYEWHQAGCGHQRGASYCAGEKWNMGFNLWHVDTKTRHSIAEYIFVDNHALLGGILYERDETEVLHLS